MNTPKPVVVCTDVSRTFGVGPAAVVAVHGSTCTVMADARIAVVGPSGSGKSTLLHLMAGLEAPSQGHVDWPQLHGTAEQRAAQIGVVFQSPSLVPALDAMENIALPLVLAGQSPAQYQGVVTHALRLVDVAPLADKLPEEMSGGQAQRVAVARVLAQRPSLILADEPTGQLDRATGQLVLDALLSVAAQLHAALVVTTHDPAVAERLDTHWFMHEGRLSTHATKEVSA